MNKTTFFAAAAIFLFLKARHNCQWSLPALGTNGSEQFRFLAYPNPTTGELIFAVESNFTLKICGLTENLLLKKQIRSTDDTADISALSNGVYNAKAITFEWYLQKIKTIKN